jgi:WD40 repeat protein
MIDMMTSQEQTLESMCQAQKSLRKHLQTADPSLGNHSDTASILTSSSNSTALTAFDFDTVIKATAVYQRCMRSRGDRTRLLLKRLSMVHLIPEPETDDTLIEEESDSASALSGTITGQGPMSSENHELECRENFALPRVYSNDTHTGVSPGATVEVSDSDSDSDSNSYTPAVSSPDDVLSMKLLPIGQDEVDTMTQRKATHMPSVDKSRRRHNLSRKVPSGSAVNVEQRHSSVPKADILSTNTTVSELSVSGTPESTIISSPGDLAELPTLDNGMNSRRWTCPNWVDDRETISRMAISSKLILAVVSTNVIRLWDLPTGKDVFQIPSVPNRSGGTCLEFSSDGTLLATARWEYDGWSKVNVWDSKIGENLFGVESFPATAIAISKNNKLIACTQRDKRPFTPSKYTVGLYEISTGQRVRRVTRSDTSAHVLSFIEDDRQLVCCSKGRVEICDVATYSQIRVWKYEALTFYRGIVTHDLMLVDIEYERLNMIDLRSGVIRASIPWYGRVQDMAYAPGTGEIVVAERLGSIVSWHPSTGRVIKPSKDHRKHNRQRVDAVAISPEGQTVVYAGADGIIRFWHTEDQDHGESDGHDTSTDSQSYDNTFHRSWQPRTIGQRVLPKVEYTPSNYPTSKQRVLPKAAYTPSQDGPTLASGSRHLRAAQKPPPRIQARNIGPQRVKQDAIGDWSQDRNKAVSLEYTPEPEIRETSYHETTHSRPGSSMKRTPRTYPLEDRS